MRGTGGQGRGTKRLAPKGALDCQSCEDWLVDGGVWERVSSSFIQHSREDAWRAL